MRMPVNRKQPYVGPNHHFSTSHSPLLNRERRRAKGVVLNRNVILTCGATGPGFVLEDEVHPARRETQERHADCSRRMADRHRSRH
jgi:hypothetical protein